MIARSNNESFSDLSIFAEADSDDNAYLLTLSSMLYQHAIDLAESNKSSPEAELTSILNELESDFGTDGKVDNTDKLTAIQLTQKRIGPAKVTQYLIDWLGDNNQFTVPDINAYLDTDLDGIANNKDDDDDNDGIADEDDTSQFVADIKKDITIKGSVEKGPFVIGSTVTISILDESGQNTDSTIVTKTTDNLGNFEFKVPEDSIIQINAMGYYRNEITGALSQGQLSLRSIYKATSDDTQNANINLLTHLTSNRVLELIKAGETDFDKAILQAEEEFSVNFNTVIAGTNNESFSNLSIYADTDSDDNAYLLTLSSMFYQHAIDLAASNESSAEAELTSILNELESDFGIDGKVNDTDMLTAIQHTQKRIDPAKVTQHLINWLGDNKQFIVPDINEYLDTDLDGIANNKDDDDDNDGIADEVDTSPYVSDFVIDNQIITLAEDESINIEIATNKPLGSDEPINFELISDVNSGSLKVDYPNISYTPTENYNGKDEFTFKLIQGNVESKLVTFSIDVTAVNDAPTIDGMPLTEIIADQEYIFIPSAVDIDGDNLTFSVENLPDWLSFDSQTGELKGTASNSNASTYNNITISVSDGGEKVSLQPFTLKVSYSILEAPHEYSHKITPQDNSQKIELEWNKVEYAHSYQLEVSQHEDFRNVFVYDEIQNNSVTLIYDPGTYFWRVATMNPDGELGYSGRTNKFQAGVFTSEFDGSGDDSAQMMIKSKDNGYVILASTNSTELSDKISNDRESWVIRLDENGDVAWQYFHNTDFEYWLHSIIELNDGSIIAAGSGDKSGKSVGVMVKLNSEGEQVWEKTFAMSSGNDGIYFSYTFANETIYLITEEYIPTDKGYDDVLFSVRSFDQNTNELSEPITLPNFDGYKIKYFRVLTSDKDGNLVLAGGLGLPYSSGTFLAVFDKDLNPLVKWHDVGSSAGGAIHVTQSNKGDYILMMQSNGNVRLAQVSPTGESVMNTELSNDFGYIEFLNKTIVQSVHDTYYLISDTDEDGVDNLIAFDSSLQIEKNVKLKEETAYSIKYVARNLIANSDGTLTVLINKINKEDYSNLGFVIRKLNPKN